MSALLQYRKESLSPEYGQRNLQALARSEVSKQKEPKVVYAQDERYLEITEWKPVSFCMISQLVRILRKTFIQSGAPPTTVPNQKMKM